MDVQEILQILTQGEDSYHQFKQNFQNVDSLTAEMIAFSNTRGGKIFVGVDDDGSVTGLTSADIGRLNQLISNAASQHIKPAINPLTEIVKINDASIMIIDISQGLNKPYQDKNGVIWVKSGADKRKATSREEIQRLFQRAGLIHADEISFAGSSLDDLDQTYFTTFFRQEYGETIEKQKKPLLQILENMNLAKHGELNLACMLLFGNNNTYKLPAFRIKCVCYPGTGIDVENYIESQDCTGALSLVYKEANAFVMRHLRSQQAGQDVNSIGMKEIPKIAVQELIANALIHRDYFVSASVRIFVFADRVEIISPGHLPNNLTVENIKLGNSNIRNPVLASFATKILPYRGLGNGIRRALQAHPHIDFTDDREGNQFICILRRPD